MLAVGPSLLPAPAVLQLLLYPRHGLCPFPWLLCLLLLLLLKMPAA
jgi:hypothetical protein